MTTCLTRFERAFDRTATVFLLFLGLTTAGATALIGF
jgi:hypothetical protein